jgi:hypothetical protein
VGEGVTVGVGVAVDVGVAVGEDVGMGEDVAVGGEVAVDSTGEAVGVLSLWPGPQPDDDRAATNNTSRRPLTIRLRVTIPSCPGVPGTDR